jgi:transposase-like protein
MPKKNKSPTSVRYTDEVKAAAVRRITKGEASIHTVATELGSSWNAVRNWVEAAKKQGAKPPVKANGHAKTILPDNDSIEELIKALQAHQAAIKDIKAKLRAKLGDE